MKKIFVLMLLFTLLMPTALSVSEASNGANLLSDVTNNCCDGYTALEYDEDPRCLYPVQSGEKYGYIDEQGVMVITPQFDEAGRFSEGYAVVKQQDLYGFVNKRGVLVIPCRYEEVQSFSEGKAAVKTDGKWGFINTAGNVIIGFQFAVCKPFSEGRAVIEYDTGYSGYIDETGEIVIPCDYIIAESFSEGLALVYSSDDKYPHFIDLNGNEAISSRRDFRSFSEGLALWDKSQKSNSRYSYINKEGKVVIDGGYMRAYPFSEGLAAVAVDYDKYYYIDTTGKSAFDRKRFRSARPFSEGYAVVSQYAGDFKINDKEIPASPVSASRNTYSTDCPPIIYATYIDHTGNYATDKIFDKAEDFSDGFAKVMDAKTQKWQLINRNFEVVWTFD